MYHIGEVIEVFGKSKNVISVDKSIQALLNMWDENIITVLVDSKISDDIKPGDFVLVDYGPISNTNNTPRMTIVKILRGELAKKAWRTYKGRLDELKGKKEKSTQIPHHQNQQLAPPTYIG